MPPERRTYEREQPVIIDRKVVEHMSDLVPDIADPSNLGIADAPLYIVTQHHPDTKTDEFIAIVDHPFGPQELLALLYGAAPDKRLGMDNYNTRVHLRNRERINSVYDALEMMEDYGGEHSLINAEEHRRILLDILSAGGQNPESLRTSPLMQFSSYEGVRKEFLEEATHTPSTIKASLLDNISPTLFVRLLGFCGIEPSYDSDGKINPRSSRNRITQKLLQLQKNNRALFRNYFRTKQGEDIPGIDENQPLITLFFKTLPDDVQHAMIERHAFFTRGGYVQQTTDGQDLVEIMFGKNKIAFPAPHGQTIRYQQGNAVVEGLFERVETPEGISYRVIPIARAIQYRQSSTPLLHWETTQRGKRNVNLDFLSEEQSQLFLPLQNQMSNSPNKTVNPLIGLSLLWYTQPEISRELGTTLQVGKITLPLTAPYVPFAAAHIQEELIEKHPLIVAIEETMKIK